LVEQRRVLEFVAGRSGEGKATSFKLVAREFELSLEAATNHLRRLWREGLIRTEETPTRRRPTLGPGESIRELRFAISRRGRERLRWYARRDEQERTEGTWGL
jgi:DNA-binding MarR family transcriptional regulator